MMVLVDVVQFTKFISDYVMVGHWQPWETYTPDMSIDLKKHHVPTTFLDKFAYWTVKALRFPTDVFFQVRI